MTLASLLVLTLAVSPGLASPVHRSWGIPEGLPQGSGDALAQTADGYLYVGTEEGLARFDGLRWETVTPSPLPGGCREVVSLAAQGNALFLGTVRCGVFRFERGRLEQVPGIERHWTQKLAFGPDGSLWGATPRELWRRTPDGKVTRVIEGMVDAFAFAPGGMYVSLNDRSFFLADDGTKRDLPGLRGKCVAGLALQGGVLYAATSDEGLWRVAADGSATAVPGPRRLMVLQADSQGVLWVGETGGALHRMAKGEPLQRVHGFDDLSPASLLEDREGSLWIGTNSHGVHQLRASHIETLGQPEGLSTAVVWTVAKDAQGAIWLGGDNAMLAKVEGDGFAVSHLAIDDAPIYEVVPDAKGRLWLGTGIGVVLKDGDRLTRFDPKSGLLPLPSAMIVRQDGTLWVGNPKGLFRSTPDDRLEQVSLPGLEPSPVMALAEGSDGAFWVGTLKGLFRFTGGKMETIYVGSGQPSDDLFDIREDSEDPGVTWVGSGSGLRRVEHGKMIPLLAADGMPEGPLFVLNDDHHGHLWAGSDHGIVRVDKQQVRDFIAGRTKRLEPVLFGLADGMRTPECNGAHASTVRGDDGQLWFATMGGAVHFHPEQLAPSPPRTQVFVSRASSEGEPVVGGGSLRRDAPNIDLHFVAPTFIDATRVHYRYRLEGFDRDWVDAGARREASYTNLPPGHYHFRVQAFVPGAWESAEAGFDFTRPRRMTEHAWFYPLLVLLGLCAVGGVSWWRVRQHRKRELWLEERVAARTAELTDALERAARSERSARIAERMAAVGTLAAGVAHEINNPLAFVSGNLDFALKELRGAEREGLPADAVEELLSALKDATDGTERLRNIVGDLKTFSRAESGPPRVVDPRAAFQVALNLSKASIKHRAKLSVDLQPVPGVLADEGRLAQVLVNLLVNAGQAIPDGAYDRNQISARCSLREDGLVVLEVQDTGSGIPPEVLPRIFDPFFTTKPVGVGTGLGLSICHGIVEAAGGRIEVESEVGKGTRFRVLLPAASADELAQSTAA